MAGGRTRTSGEFPPAREKTHPLGASEPTCSQKQRDSATTTHHGLEIGLTVATRRPKVFSYLGDSSVQKDCAENTSFRLSPIPETEAATAAATEAATTTEAATSITTSGSSKLDESVE